MPLNHTEIIEDLEEHIRKTGGAAGEWWVGTAKDPRSSFFPKHLVADLGDGLVYREAFTASAAGAVVDHFVRARGLHLDQDDAPEPGRIVFVCQKKGATES